MWLPGCLDRWHGCLLIVCRFGCGCGRQPIGTAVVGGRVVGGDVEPVPRHLCPDPDLIEKLTFYGDKKLGCNFHKLFTGLFIAPGVKESAAYFNEALCWSSRHS